MITQGPSGQTVDELTTSDPSGIKPPQAEDYSPVQQIKDLRRLGDNLIQSVKGAQPSREISLAITKFQEGVMWLGMELKRMGEANPYPSSKDPNTGDKIEPTADNLKF